MPDTYTTKLWGGRFRGDEDALMQRFNSECWRTDWLVEPDIEGSLAHVAMLERCGLLTAAEREVIADGLRSILADYRAGKLAYTEEYEDAHTFVELHLIRRIGDVGKKLHTARSRNDQCNVDMKLYVKRQTGEVAALIDALCAALEKTAQESGATAKVRPTSRSGCPKGRSCATRKPGGSWQTFRKMSRWWWHAAAKADGATAILQPPPVRSPAFPSPGCLGRNMRLSWN